MSVRIDERIARCLLQLQSPEFKPLVEFLKARQQETLDRLVEAQSTDQMVRLQGRSVELKEILELVDQGSVLVAKTRRQTPQ